MFYQLKNCRTGEEAVYSTSLEVSENKNFLKFNFIADNSEFYCPCKGYNKIHTRGDACEILIGSDPERKVYYEIEINPNNDIMIAEMNYLGVDSQNNPILKINFVNKSFVVHSVIKTKNSYKAEIIFNKNNIITGDNKNIYFNAYRTETDGGIKEKHLFALIPTMCSKFHVPKYYTNIKEFL